MARYLVVGAAGYTGAYLAKQLLERGHTVRGLVRNPDADAAQQLAAYGMQVWEGDLLSPESLVGVAQGVDIVYNLTSAPLLEHETLRRLFLEGNRNLIAACSRALSVRLYLFAGNVAAYGDQGDAWVDEDTPPEPCYPFGRTMVDVERLILDMARRHRFPAALLRLGTIYGPGRDMVDAVLSSTATLIGNGRNFRSFIHIADLVRALELLADTAQPGATYVIGDDTPARAAEVYGEIRERLGMLPPRSFPRSSALAAGMDPDVVGMLSASVRLRNTRLIEETGLVLRYPSFRAWLDERMQEIDLAELEVGRTVVTW